VLLEGLSKRLAQALSNLAESSSALGKPELVAAAAAESAKTFQKYGKALPSGEHAKTAILAFMHSRPLDDNQMDLIAGALADPVRELAGARPIGQATLRQLLQSYSKSARAGELPHLTWYGLLSSYFKYDPSSREKTDHAGWQQLRSFLQETWPIIDREAGTAIVPDWITVLRGDPALMTADAAGSYALDFLRGEDAAVRRLGADLAIPQSSWFWHALVLGAVQRAADMPDADFKEMIPRLLTLLQGRPVFRDAALVTILTRYHQCREQPPHQVLVDYVVQKDVWRNPKLKAAGIATSWNQVSDGVWQMVLGWVNERNLRDFFEILAARNDSDEGRLAFWSQYLKQITWTRLVFGADTRRLVRQNTAIRELIAREEGAYATLTQGDDHDAFMMQLGEYIVVEFSKKPNAAYVYKAANLKFDRYATQYAGTTDDLKYGFPDGRPVRFTHQTGWADEALLVLKRLGIHPDSSTKTSKPRPSENSSATKPAAQRTRALDSVDAIFAASETGPGGQSQSKAALEQPRAPAPEGAQKSDFLPDAPRGASFKMKTLAELVRRFDGAYIDDKRRPGGQGGRLWVEDPKQDSKLEQMLLHLGFKWAPSRQAFYFPESS
jgi:hypothetical protein